MPTWITSEDELAAHYGAPRRPAVAKVAAEITPEYRAYIEHAPFCALASVGPEGIDCSPRGDNEPVVTIVDAKTLAMPDRRGNDRIDSLRNIVRDPRVSLMFLVPGSDTVIRVNGKGRMTADDDVCKKFEKEGKMPRTVLFIEIDEIYFQCAKSVLRSRLWDGGLGDPSILPSAGAILQAMTAKEIVAETYDAEWPERARQTFW